MTDLLQQPLPIDSMMSETSKQGRREVDAFRDYLKKLPEKRWLNQSFCTDWTIKDIAEHQVAQGFLMLDAAHASLRGTELPIFGPETLNRYTASLQDLNRLELADKLAHVTHDFYDLLDRASPEQLARPAAALFGNLSLSTIGSVRLSELSLHSWDVRVVDDLTARISRESLPLLFPGLVSFLPFLANREAAGQMPATTYQFEIKGPVKGPVALSFDGGQIISQPGYAEQPDVIVKLDSEVFLRMAWGRARLGWMIKDGWVKIEGDEQAALKLTDLFRGI